VTSLWSKTPNQVFKSILFMANTVALTTVKARPRGTQTGSSTSTPTNETASISERNKNSGCKLIVRSLLVVGRDHCNSDLHEVLCLKFKHYPSLIWYQFCSYNFIDKFCNVAIDMDGKSNFPECHKRIYMDLLYP